jgi:uncharacterized protein YbcC (UPF0753/DUF2309 family)/formate hydrogenlyase subunit 3/multisubunit Na+/H+ antiporter MnhD subunit
MRLMKVTQFFGATLALVATVLGFGLARGHSPFSIHVGVGAVDVGFFMDPLSCILLGFVGLITWLVASYAVRNLRGQNRTERFGGLLLLCAFALVVMVSGASLPVIALGWTVSGLALSALLAHTASPQSRRAARFVRRRLLIGDAFLWSAVVVAIAILPSVNREALTLTQLTWGPATLVTLLLAAAAVVRSALVPMQRWLPETAEAPSPVSAYLHAGIINGAGIIGALMWPLFLAAPVTLVLLVVVGATSVVVGTLSGRVRADVKGQLACSTTAQMGYMTLQLGLGLPAAAVLHLIGHGCYKSWLFLRAGGAVTRLRMRPVQPVTHSVAGVRLALVIATIVVSTSLGLIVASSSISELGVSAVVPGLLAIFAAFVAVLAVARERATTMQVALVGGLAVAATTGYLAILGAWERLLTSPFPLQSAWSPLAGTSLVLFIVLAGVLAAIGPRVMNNRPNGLLSRLVDSSAQAPWISSLPSVRVLPHVTATEMTQTLTLVERAAHFTAPAWPLRSVVAASALAGLESQTYEHAAATSAADLGGRAFLPLASYANLLQSGRITRTDLDQALMSQEFTTRETGSVDELIARARNSIDTGSTKTTSKGPSQPTVPDPALELAHVWCQRAWSRALDDSKDPWSLWRASGNNSVPADPAEALTALLIEMKLSELHKEQFVHALLTSGPGWAGHASWRARQAGEPTAIVQLAALRAALTLAAGGPTFSSQKHEDDIADDAPIWQAALEASFRNPLVTRVSEAATHAQRDLNAKRHPRARAQLVFCIDVRSERIRRAIESVGDYETLGFAGFFGAAARYIPESGVWFDQCPVLISPSFDVHSVPRPPDLRAVLRSATRATTSSPVSPLVIAEAAGLAAGLASACQTFTPNLWHRISSFVGVSQSHWPEAVALELDLSARVQLASGALRAMGLVDQFADIIVICGHAASVENNAFAAAYDCGACGGNGGAVNARLLAQVINDCDVRDALFSEGIVIPATTKAIAGVHDTTTDAIRLDPAESGDRAFAVQFESLSKDLSDAQAHTLIERLPDLPGAPKADSQAARLHANATRRGHDWAQPFPEWGLAGNAAFVIGPREFTRSLDLGGRVFLHSYDPEIDTDRSILELILTAPAIVTQWINAQYNLSTLDPIRFGSGDKATHNVVGDVGVLTGAHGDLRGGLPWQALFASAPGNSPDGGEHEPLRLLVVAYAERGYIHKIVTQNQGLKNLCENGWITLCSIDPNNGEAARLTRTLGWDAW